VVLSAKDSHSLNESEIVVGGDLGEYSSSTSYKLAKIQLPRIVMPEESKWPAAGLFFKYDGQPEFIGIEKSVSLTRLAQALTDAGVPVALDGWYPN